MKNWFSLLIAISISNAFLIGQQAIPPLINFQEEIPSFSPQNWCVSQDLRGIIYISNTTGIIEFDGQDWRLLENTILLEALKTAKSRDGIIHLGGYGDLGYLGPDSTGNLNFISLLPQLPDSVNGFQKIKNTIAASEKIYFLDRKNLYQWDGNEMSTSRSDTTFRKLFVVNDVLYVHERTHGLKYMKEGNLIHVPNYEKFENLYIKGIVPTGKARDRQTPLIIFTQTKGPLYYDWNQLKPFESNLSKYLAGSQIINVQELENGLIALATIGKGIVICDGNLNVISIYGAEEGLLDETAISVSQDETGLIWAGLNRGIAKIDIHSQFKFLDEQNGLNDLVSAAFKFEDHLLFGTFSGLYKYENPNSLDARLTKLNQLDLEVFEISKFNSGALIGSSDGLYYYDGKSTTKILDLSVSSITQSQLDTNRIYLGLVSGITSAYYNKGEWMDEGKIAGVNNEITSIVERPDGKIWALFEEAFLIDFPNRFSNPNAVQQMDSTQGFKDDLHYFQGYNINDQVYICSEHGIHTWDENSQKLVQDSSFSTYFTEDGFEAFNLVEDKSGSIWVSSQGHCGPLMPQEDGSWVWDTIPYKIVDKSGVWCIYPDDDGIVWIGTNEGVVRYDHAVKKDYNIEYPALIRRVTLNEDSIIFHGAFSDEDGQLVAQQPEHWIRSFDYSANNISFQFSASFYEGLKKMQFSAFLEGEDEQWSNWSDKYERNYTNLNEGEYTFYVKAKNVYGVESTTAYYIFSILPPWYRTWWAFLLYGIIGIGVVVIIVQLNVRRLQKAKVELEKIVKQRTKEIWHQKEEIQKQKEDIEVEKQKSDNLLLNILPEEVANELKERGEVEAKEYDEVTVLFTDFKDFTSVSAKLNAKELVGNINLCFKEFDGIIGQFNIEKIKTIGDAYMAAGGLQLSDNYKIEDLIRAALAMQKFMLEGKTLLLKKGGVAFDMRLGIHTGPVVAGIVGVKKFQYDIWGDTVNIASRMESNGDIGKVNISRATYELIKDIPEFQFEARGKVEVKGKGMMEMFFVS